MSIPIEAKVKSESDNINALINRIKFEMRCAAPGIIKKFNAQKQTVDVQLVTKEKIVIKGKLVSRKVPELGDVPVGFIRYGNFVLTMPIKVGDECLVVFSDTCIDAWFQSGGEENEQISGRRHDLSDAIAICGIFNQKKVIENYSEDSAQLRNLDGTEYVEVTDNSINIKATSNVNIESEGTVDVKGTGDVNIESEGKISIVSTGNISIESSGIVEVTGTAVNIAEGLQGVARLGDSVQVDPITHQGTITSASEKVKAG